MTWSLGGTQSAGGICLTDGATYQSGNGNFGKGCTGASYGGGGGAGYYGGSGYIANTLLSNKHMYCYNCQTSNDTNTKTLSGGTSSCHSMGTTFDCAKEGNGQALITLISAN